MQQQLVMLKTFHQVEKMDDTHFTSSDSIVVRDSYEKVQPKSFNY